MAEIQTPLEELEQALADQFTAIFPDGIDGEVVRETFQSSTFQRAGYAHIPERYGCGDRFLYTITRQDGSITFVVTGRVNSGNPFEVVHAVSGGLDLRKDMTVVYQFDGKGKITETRLKTGEKNEYIGEQGNPTVLLQHIKQSLGKQITD